MFVHYDILADQSLPATTSTSELEKQLRAEYRIPEGVNTIDWACSSRGRDAFRERVGKPGQLAEGKSAHAEGSPL